jgi:predicted HD phosphohydrolase
MAPVPRVTGIGGFFFRAKDPAALGRWYQLHFGIDRVPADYSQRPWSQEILALSIPPR